MRFAVGSLVKVRIQERDDAPVGRVGLVESYTTHYGYQAALFTFGRHYASHTMGPLSLEKYKNPKAEVLWNRLRTKEDMAARALSAWGVSRLRVSVAPSGFGIDADIRNTDFTFEGRSLSEIAHNIFVAAYEFRFKTADLMVPLKEVLAEADAVRELVEAM